MISFKGIFLTLFFVILSIGFTDFFVQFENRCEMTYMYQVPQYVVCILCNFDGHCDLKYFLF